MNLAKRFPLRLKSLDGEDLQQVSCVPTGPPRELLGERLPQLALHDGPCLAIPPGLEHDAEQLLNS
jgi:hypothetical protein